MRSVRKSEEKKSKFDVHCYDWKTLVEKGELDTLKVPELDKYIERNKLVERTRKILVQLNSLPT